MPTSKIIKSNAKAALSDKWPQAFAIAAITLSVWAVHIVFFQSIAAVFTNFFNETAGLLISFSIIILFLPFFFMPLLYGVLRWFWFTSTDCDVPVYEIFCYFSDGKQHIRAVSLSFRVFFRTAVILFVSFLPSLIIALAGNPSTYKILNSSMPYWVSSLWTLGNVFNLFGIITSVTLLMRYFTAPILMINNPEISPQEALNLSVIISKNANGKTLSFLFSFIGWAVLSFLILPMLFIIPYFFCSYAVYCKFLINHYNSAIDKGFNSYYSI